jgi:hypothetical protein
MSPAGYVLRFEPGASGETVETAPERTFTGVEMRQVRTEAQKIRARLRDSEHTVTQLRGRVEAHDRADALRIADGTLTRRASSQVLTASS